MPWDELKPGSTGTYALWMYLAHPQRLHVGVLRQVLFLSGYYFYLGSAYGPGGLNSRLERHSRFDKKIHWHIDHLRTVSRILGALVWEGEYRRATARHLPGECLWSQALQTLPGACVPAPGFGSQDCSQQCTSHLVHFSHVDITVILQTLQPLSPGLRLLYPD